MEVFTRKFHPSSFDLTNIEPINSAFVQYVYIGDDKYEMVEAEKIKSSYDDVITFFKNGERISESYFHEKTKKRFCVEKNRVVFLHNSNICFLDIYIKPNYQIIPVVTIEFANVDERDRYVPLEWFGQEVSEKFYNEKALYHSLQAVAK
jgi:hypothetical protein